MRVFDTSFDYKTDNPAKKKPDPDKDSPRLKADHELLWTKDRPTKNLPTRGLFAPSTEAARSNEYLIYTDASGARHCYGSDAITTSYSTWSRSKSTGLHDAIAELDDEQRSRYLNPPYTIGSAMIWPVRTKDRPTMNQARGTRLRIADRMDLTLVCIRRHYAREPGSPLADVIEKYKDFFDLFGDFRGFVDFFHFQDLVTSDYQDVEYLLPFNEFKRSAVPTTKGEYVTYRENTLEFIEKRGRRMAQWVRENHPEVEVRP